MHLNLRLTASVVRSLSIIQSIMQSSRSDLSFALITPKSGFGRKDDSL